MVSRTESDTFIKSVPRVWPFACVRPDAYSPIEYIACFLARDYLICARDGFSNIKITVCMPRSDVRFMQPRGVSRKKKKLVYRANIVCRYGKKERKRKKTNNRYTHLLYTATIFLTGNSANVSSLACIY